jgi:hypothetical protein
MTRTVATLCLVAVISLCAWTAAFAHGGDMGLTTASGQLTVGLIGEDEYENEYLDTSINVFGSELDFGETLISQWATNHPGFEAFDLLTANSHVRVDLLSCLWAWNGSGVETTNKTLTVSYAGLGSTTSGAGYVHGGFWAPVDETGYVHMHLTQAINGASESESGVYIIKGQFVSDADGASNPFAIVYNMNADEETHDAAIEWAKANVVPEPASVLAMGMGLVGLIGMRRRK